MSDETRNHLYRTMLGIRNRLIDVIACVDDGVPYYTEDDLPEGYRWDGSAVLGPDGDEVDPDDVPDVEWRDPHDYLTEYALDVVDERGRNFAVVLTTGGPHIEIEAEGYGRAALEGYWGGERVTLTDDVFDRVLDWFIERD